MFRESFGADKAKVPLRQLIDSLVAYFFSFHLKAPAFYNLLLASAISGDLRQRLNAFLDSPPIGRGAAPGKDARSSEDDAALVARYALPYGKVYAAFHERWTTSAKRTGDRAIENRFRKISGASGEAPDASLKEQ